MALVRYNWDSKIIENLINDYNNGFSLNKLSKKYGMTSGGIKLRLLKNNVKLRVILRNVRKDIDTVDLVNDYKKGMTIKMVSEKYKMSYTTVKLRLLQKIKLRIPEGKNHGNWKGGISRWFCYVHFIRKKCCMCNAKKDLMKHHLDDNHKNNESKNIFIVCRSCHSKIHNVVLNMKGFYGVYKRN